MGVSSGEKGRRKRGTNSNGFGRAFRGLETGSSAGDWGDIFGLSGGVGVSLLSNVFDDNGKGREAERTGTIERSSYRSEGWWECDLRIGSVAYFLNLSRSARPSAFGLRCKNGFGVGKYVTVANFLVRLGDLTPCNTSNNSSSSISTSSSSLSESSGSESMIWEVVGWVRRSRDLSRRSIWLWERFGAEAAALKAGAFFGKLAYNAAQLSISFNTNEWELKSNKGNSKHSGELSEGEKSNECTWDCWWNGQREFKLDIRNTCVSSTYKCMY